MNQTVYLTLALATLALTGSLGYALQTSLSPPAASAASQDIPSDGSATFGEAAASPATPDGTPTSPAGSAPANGPGQGPSGQLADAHADEPTIATPAWNPNGAIHPGIQTFTDGAQCTANFVFYDATGIYVGQAAHCAGTGAATDTNGCTAGTLPLGTAVDLGTGNDGVLVYSSWIAMQEAKTPSSAPECYGNDFALVQVAAADEDNVNPAVPFFGGPVGLAGTDGLGIGDAVYSYGNSGLRLGIEPGLSWKHGNIVSADAWGADLYTATPGIPGDSGSGFMDAQGNAIGVLSTVALLPLPLSNYISGLSSALAYQESHGGPQVELATAPWVGGLA